MAKCAPYLTLQAAFVDGCLCPASALSWWWWRVVVLAFWPFVTYILKLCPSKRHFECALGVTFARCCVLHGCRKANMGMSASLVSAWCWWGRPTKTSSTHLRRWGSWSNNNLNRSLRCETCANGKSFGAQMTALRHGSLTVYIQLFHFVECIYLS